MREEILVESGRHEDHAQVATTLTQRVAQDHQQEVRLDRALVHLVDDDVRGTRERGVLLQPPEQDARRAEEQPRGRRRLVLQADRVAHRAPERFAALRSDALRHAHGRDATRLRADNRDGGPRLGRLLQEELRHLRRLSAAGIALQHRHLRVTDRLEHIILEGCDRQARAVESQRAAILDRRNGTGSARLRTVATLLSFDGPLPRAASVIRLRLVVRTHSTH